MLVKIVLYSKFQRRNNVSQIHFHMRLGLTRVARHHGATPPSPRCTHRVNEDDLILLVKVVFFCEYHHRFWENQASFYRRLSLTRVARRRRATPPSPRYTHGFNADGLILPVNVFLGSKYHYRFWKNQASFYRR